MQAGCIHAASHIFEQDVRLLGHRWSPRVHELKRFLARSGVRFRWFDLDIEGEAEIKRIVAEAGSTSQAYPDRDPARWRRPERSGCRDVGRAARSADGTHVDAVRPRRHRRRTGRPGGVDLRRIRGSSHGGRRAGCPGRPGELQRHDRELSGLPERPRRQRPRPTHGRAGGAIRGRDRRHPARDEPALR